MAQTIDRPTQPAEHMQSPRHVAPHVRRAPVVPPDTLGGLPLKTSYDPSDTAGLDVERDLGEPGSYPYTRGLHPTGYRGKVWTMRQFAGFGSPRQTNERFRFLLAKGQTGLSTAFDLPTLMGLDSDDPRAFGEVGRRGASSACSTFPGSTTRTPISFAAS